MPDTKKSSLQKAVDGDPRTRLRKMTKSLVGNGAVTKASTRGRNHEMASDQVEKFPWKDDATNYIGCNFAYADLTHNLPHLLTVDGKLHAETFVAASGAVAGFAAQQALLAQKLNFSIDTLNETSTNDGLFIVRSPSGDRYLYGDPLKLMVFCGEKTPTQITARLWEWAAGGAIEAGLAKSDLPDTLTIWENVNRSIRGGLEGMLSVPKEHWPHLAPTKLLEWLWPIAKQLLTGKGSGAAAPPGIGARSSRHPTARRPKQSPRVRTKAIADSHKTPLGK
jgi:hypothetical protein